MGRWRCLLRRVRSAIGGGAGRSAAVPAEGSEVEADQLLVGPGGQIGFEHDLDPGGVVLQQEHWWRSGWWRRVQAEHSGGERLEVLVGVVGKVLGELVEEWFERYHGEGQPGDLPQSPAGGDLPQLGGYPDTLEILHELSRCLV